MKYCYSMDQEEYYGEFYSVEEAIAVARSIHVHGVVWIGEIVHASEFIEGRCSIFAGSLIENIDEYLYDHVGGDEPVLKMDEETLKKFGEVIFGFVKEHGDFNRWGVKNIQSFDAK